MGKKIREFMTHREPPEHIWMEREESAVIGTARMGQRLVPKIRPFDLLRSTPLIPHTHPRQAHSVPVRHNRVHALATWRSYGRTHGGSVRGVPVRSGVGRDVFRARRDPAGL